MKMTPEQEAFYREVEQSFLEAGADKVFLTLNELAEFVA